MSVALVACSARARRTVSPRPPGLRSPDARSLSAPRRRLGATTLGLARPAASTPRVCSVPTP
eukprot:694085-Prymnesium_polylepis.1